MTTIHLNLQSKHLYEVLKVGCKFLLAKKIPLPAIGKMKKILQYVKAQLQNPMHFPNYDRIWESQSQIHSQSGTISKLMYHHENINTNHVCMQCASFFFNGTKLGTYSYKYYDCDSITVQD